MRQLARDQRGFSLAEMLVVTAVLGLVMAGVIAIQQKGQQLYMFGSNRVEAQQNARVALDIMTRELRSAQSMVTLGSASDVTFVDQNNTQVQYQLSGTDLNRISGGTTATIIGGVQTLTMTYCAVWNAVTNSCTTTAATPSAVTVIRVQLTARTEDTASAGSLGDRRMTVETAIRLRNVNSI
jgi:prepilin-type N-terminal cleavage/methylation domain-containing protein